MTDKDFDKLFAEYVQKHRQDACTCEHHNEDNEIELLYMAWAKEPCEQLGGVSPTEYVRSISDPSMLVAMLAPDGVTSLVVDRISEVKECVPYLCDLLSTEEDERLLVTAAELLRSMHEQEPLTTYLERLPSEADGDFKEMMISTLKVNVEKVRERLYEMINDANMALSTVIAEILIEGVPDERTFELLIRLFTSGENNALYASYLARYGDVRASAYLYRALDSVGYADFCEVRNAIEVLGGTVDEQMRNFDGDSEYAAIKGNNSDNI